MLNWGLRMRVRIRLGPGRRVHKKGRKNQHVALALAALLIPAAVMAYVLAGWRLMADVNVTGQFPITSGLFSHWLVWFILASVLNVLAIVLNRWGNPAPKVEIAQDQPQRDLANSRL